MNRSVQIAVAWIVVGVVWLLVLTFHRAPKLMEDAKQVAYLASSSAICIHAGSDLKLYPYPSTKQQRESGGIIVPQYSSYCHSSLKAISISAEPLFFIDQDFLPEDWCESVDALDKLRDYRECQRKHGPNNKDCVAAPAARALMEKHGVE